MAKPESNVPSTSGSPTKKPTVEPFLLTAEQGEAARALLGYVSSLPLNSPDAQLLAVVVAIRAARGGVGNLTGGDLSSLRLADPAGAIGEVRKIGWQVTDELLVGDPETPVAVTVPDLAGEADRRLPFGKQKRSRVSGWTTRTLAAKPVKRATPATRLAALFLAAHSTSQLHGDIPSGLPEVCRTALPELLRSGFLAELVDGQYRLAPAVRHLSGLRRAATTDARNVATQPGAAGKSRTAAEEEFDAAGWERWKEQASPALRRHVAAVENCALCALPVERIAAAFTDSPAVLPFQNAVRAAYGAWKDAHPDRGPLAAGFTVTFRAEHGHGPSFTQLCAGLGWNLPRPLRSFVVRRLLANEWLTDTAPVPWTLRPGRTAQAQDITLPGSKPVATS
ncbi:hypothetical protein [Streptomyces sp. R35]|uniref:Uncharacterized protein n=1 Tax=Streptomyces sp. R35 TaxID=3238630 RepID=A0AB39SFN5_9ACTN